MNCTHQLHSAQLARAGEFIRHKNILDELSNSENINYVTNEINHLIQEIEDSNYSIEDKTIIKYYLSVFKYSSILWLN